MFLLNVSRGSAHTAHVSVATDIAH